MCAPAYIGCTHFSSVSKITMYCTANILWILFIAVLPLMASASRRIYSQLLLMNICAACNPIIERNMRYAASYTQNSIVRPNCQWTTYFTHCGTVIFILTSVYLNIYEYYIYI